MNSRMADSSWIRTLSEEIGPRPPAGQAERDAAALIAGRIRELGLEPDMEEFASSRSFGPAYLVVFGLGLLARPVSRVSRTAGALTGLLALALGVAESRFFKWSPLHRLRRGRSQNVWGRIGPTAAPSEPQRTICLVSHMDSSRSGLMFHPSVTPHLGRLVEAAGLALLVNALAPVLRGLLPGRIAAAVARSLLVISALMVLERELRGEDVPGANDNASGVAACLNLAGHFKLNPLRCSRLVVLITGSEESGVIGMRDFLERHDTEGWVFINFDGVSADAPLRVLSREGGTGGWEAEPELLAAAEAVGRENPDLKAVPLKDGSGLPYDSTPVLARGGRAITVVNQEGAIPDYHWPTDTASRINDEAFARAVRFGVALARKLDESSGGSR